MVMSCYHRGKKTREQRMAKGLGKCDVFTVSVNPVERHRALHIRLKKEQILHRSQMIWGFRFDSSGKKTAG